MNLPQLVLQRGKDASVRRFHPWIFSGAVDRIIAPAEPADGDVVAVVDYRAAPIGLAHFQPHGSIVGRVFHFSEHPAETPDEAFWAEKFRAAWERRRRVGLVDNPHTTAFRLIHAEGDGLPGLIVDYYAGTAVLQAHSMGMYRARPLLARALAVALGPRYLTAVYDKSADTLGTAADPAAPNGYLVGEAPADPVVLENGHRFRIDWLTGQKTGFFLDQRDSRALVGHYARGRRVLNTFCYTGGFSVYALAGGATAVDSVDSSKTAMALTDVNVALNFPDAAATGRHRSFTADVFDFLRGPEVAADPYDLIILDPPAFAKSRAARVRAEAGYRRLNAEALRRIKPGGLLFTFSCSQVVDRELFTNTVRAAALEVGRPVRLLHYLSQPADHAPSFFHPEGEYLKGLVLEVE
ncbi:MAG: class I SAM-dependent rRNA methyltransferase [Hymenobacteraceae bacterium]|nr:class I SAM-dependent rRNA methyltransferase [Hymenobacteraceae bacterium]